MEPVDGFDEQKSSLLERVMPMLDEYVLVKLKIQQLRQRQTEVPRDLQMVLNKCVHEISDALLLP